MVADWIRPPKSQESRGAPSGSSLKLDAGTELHLACVERSIIRPLNGAGIGLQINILAIGECWLTALAAMERDDK